MIDSICGAIKCKSMTRVVIDCHGVGYELFIPFSTYESIGSVGDGVDLLAHLVHRDVSMELFGFATEQERSLFRSLISVSGIGPKIALAVLSGISPSRFASAILEGDCTVLTKISGIGNKTAQRTILELKDKISKLIQVIPQTEKPKSRIGNEAVQALVALGYKELESSKAIAHILKESPDLTTEQLIKRVLREF